MPLNDPWLPRADQSGYIATQRYATPMRVTRRTDSSSTGTTGGTTGGPIKAGSTSTSTNGTATTNPPTTGGTVSSYQILDNVAWLSIANRIGDDPGVATLRYRFGTGDPDSPANVEQALSNAVKLGKSVEPGDRIVIFAQRPDGVWEAIFDGFALEFGGSQGSELERADIRCLGVGFRLRDAPITGSEWRHGITFDPQFFDSEIEPHFNPKGKGNRDPRPIGAWPPEAETDPTKKYPAFVDITYVGDPSFASSLSPVKWMLPDAARVLINKYNRKQAFVKNVSGDTLDATLIARIPIDGVKYDPANASSYTAKPIEVPDKPIGGKDLASTLRALIRGKGFETAFRTGPSAPGSLDPSTLLDVFMPQLRPAVDVWLQPRGQALDLSLTNLAGWNVARDLSGVANEWTVEGDLREFEISFVLAAGWATNPGQDLTPAGLAQFNKTTAGYKVNDFRYYIVGEGGEAVYTMGGNTPVVGGGGDLNKVFGPTAPDGNGNNVYPYVFRNRAPAPHLLTLDDRGKPLGARLSVSTDYSGGGVGTVWDGTSKTAGTWQPILGGWESLKDRIGVYVNCPDVNAWAIGKATQVGYPFPAGVLNVVECLVKKDAAIKRPLFYLRYTCVVKADQRLKGTASRKLNNVLPTAIARTVEARDRYKKQTIHAGSEFQPTATADVITRDDTDLAAAEAQAIQAVSQNGQLAGPLVVPRFTRAYQVGDPIRGINGRGLTFRTDSDGNDAVPTYPIVTAVIWDNDGKQSTTLETSDADAARPTLSKNHVRGRLGLGARRA